LFFLLQTNFFFVHLKKLGKMATADPLRVLPSEDEETSVWSILQRRLAGTRIDLAIILISISYSF